MSENGEHIRVQFFAMHMISFYCSFFLLSGVESARKNDRHAYLAGSDIKLTGLSAMLYSET